MAGALWPEGDDPDPPPWPSATHPTKLSLITQALQAPDARPVHWHDRLRTL